MGFFPSGYYGITSTPTPTPTPTPGADTLIRLRYSTGATLYTQIEGGAGVWDGTDYATFASANWASYATSTPETPSGSGRYVCQFPIASPAGNYAWSIYLRAGASPAVGDVCVGEGSGYWDGTTFGGASKVTDGVEASLPDPAPPGYGSNPPAGTTPVTQDTGGANAMTVTDTNDEPIFGAVVSAYLASSYASNPATATAITDTTTDVNGHWTLHLPDGATYTLVFMSPGDQPATANVTVA